MESERGAANVSTRPQIDLNEVPITSPGVAQEVVIPVLAAEATVSGVSVCSVCGIPAGRLTEQPQQDWRCFHCLLKNGGSGSGGDGAAVGGGGVFNINASLQREAETQRERNLVDLTADVAVLVRRDPKVDHGGSSKIQTSQFTSLSSHCTTITQSDCLYADNEYNLRKTLCVATNTTISGFKDTTYHGGPSFDGKLRTSNYIGTEYSTQSSNMAYLQSLREYISERKGVLGEGWCVELDYDEEICTTSVIYIAPDGTRIKSKEDVARYLGLSLSYPCVETESGNNGFGVQNELQNDQVKETSRFLTVGNSRQRQSNPRSANGQGFLSGSGTIDGPDNRGDGFPIQFQDFFLVSAGNIDSRLSYHSTNQIWPVGYRSSWHDKITGSFFVCDVEDGGESGPTFKVRRYPCSIHSIPIGSTVLSRPKLSSCYGDDKLGKDDSAISQVVDDESVSVHMMLNEHSPPSLDDNISISKKGKEVVHSQEVNSSTLPQGSRTKVDLLGVKDNIGEFQVEGKSSSSVWEMVSQVFLDAFHERYKQKGAFLFFCVHGPDETHTENPDILDSLSKFSCSAGPINIPQSIQNEDEYNTACEMLLAWLRRDRFGLDAEFVQEILEKLPGVTTCSEYKFLNDRKHEASLQTVGSGFLLAKRKSNLLGDPESDSSSGNYKRPKLQTHDSQRDPCPPGKPLNSKLAAYLIGDALQVWELAWHFLDVLGLGKPFSFRELESELIVPWLDSYPMQNSGHKTLDNGDVVVFPARVACLSRCTGLILARIHGSLLKLLVPELLSKVAVHVCPNFDSGEYKSRKGRKKDIDFSAALKKAKLNMLPVNELTWPEIARRYILAVLSMEGNLDSTEIASRESGKVFHCLRGDGGTLCGSLTGIAALEADAVILADAMKQIFGSLKGKSEVVSIFVKESDTRSDSQTIKATEGELPEWAEVLEPVRKLPTNVGARIKKCILEALEREPPESVRKILEHSISKEVYKGNASGPTKRAVMLVLANVSREIPWPKAQKKEKGWIIINLSDLIMKQCRIVLRRAAATDKDRVFCNLLGRTFLSPNDNDDEGLLGYPAMVSRPLDFRTIDLRLAGGAYGESHEAFIDDVREVCNNLRTAYGDRSDLTGVAEKLSQKFEDLYEKEVITLVHKIAEFADLDSSSGEATKERDDFLASIYEISLPRAPWDGGICKVCGMDRDDDNVLLCDKCDSEYHRYCLSPPLTKIPEGNWYCPSCVGKSISGSTAHSSAVNQHGKRKNQGEFMHKFLESMTRLVNLLETKEYWEFTVNERVLLLKFLFDEALNSASIHDHIDQRASRTSELQQKLRSISSELKTLQSKEEPFAANVEKANSSISSFSDRLENPLQLDRQGDYNKEPGWSPSRSNLVKHCASSSNQAVNVSDALGQLRYQQCAVVQSQQKNISPHVHLPQGDSCLNELPVSTEQQSSFLSAGQSTPSSHMSECAHSADDYKNDVSALQTPIASTESELLKVSLRKDFLGRDSNGRVYWVLCWPDTRPWIVANGSLTSKKRGPEEFIGVPNSSTWMSYESESEIEKLLSWLQESNEREKDLKDSILQWLCTKPKDSFYDENHILDKHESFSSIHSEGRKTLPATNAMNALKKKFGPCLENKISTGGSHKNLASEVSRNGMMYRCECLELLWPSKEHCPSCHQSFSMGNELSQHSIENCKTEGSTSKRSPTTEDASKSKKPRNASPQETCSAEAGIIQRSTSEKPRDGLSSVEPECPFNYEEIKARFIIQSPIKEMIKDIGLIASGGIPSFLPGEFRHPSDPALVWGSMRENEVSAGEIQTDLVNQQQESGNDPCAIDSMNKNDKLNNLSRCGEKVMGKEGSEVDKHKSISTSERNQISPMADKNLVLSLSKSCIIPDSPWRPLVGRASEILRILKISLLDMDAALPEGALRISRSNHSRRCAWRRFVKSANTIYEMIQAIITLEETIKSEYLRSDWWYWSSPSTAAKVSTLSALALRIYALDSVISYEKPVSDGTTKNPISESALNKEASIPTNLVNSTSPSGQKTLELNPVKNTRSRRKLSKRRNDRGGQD